ncbi:tetratricopeptide repeat protein [Lysinibacillus fusiformis]|uniref:tetratricopeptide repeat protein n=1 Tax=Lysinibacillus fusiformis TaxID=28031 RepID=UPI003D0050DC
MSQLFFSNYTNEIENMLKNDLLNSTYCGMFDDLEKLVTLADRLAISCQKHPHFTNISSFLKNIERAFTDPNDADQASQVLLNVEKWIKPVLYFSDKEKWEKLNQEKHFFTLKPTVTQLRLLSQQEMEAEMPDAFEDVGKKYIWIAINSRNYETHNTALSSSELRLNYLRCAMTIILVPLYLNYDVIKANLEGLLCRQIDAEAEDLIASIRVSRREEIKGFKARQDLVEKIAGKLTGELRESGGYYLLTGIEGIGKTALCAKVSEQLLAKQDSLIEPDVNIKQVAPWLPGQLIHFGKWESDPVRILRSLIAQANTMLLEPEDLPNHSPALQELDKMSFYNSSSQMKRAISGEHFGNYSKQLFSPAKNFSNSSTQENVVSLPLNTNSMNQPTYIKSELEIHKAIFSRALRKLTKEYGPVIIIIDALDEITTFLDNLEFLPRQLPPGVSALLTVRPNLGIEKWLTNYSSALVYPDQVGYIERGEIPLFTGIDDFAGKEEKKFNEQIYRSSKGWSLQIAAIARKLKEVNGDFTQVDVEDELGKYFDRQKDEWLRAYEDGRSEYLKEVLHILAIFEPISAISLDDVQGYLEKKFNERLNLDKIIDLLKPVSYQIQGLETAKKNIKLGIKAYADYVKKCIGKRDLKRHLEDYTEWMKDDKDIESKLVADFVNYWMSEGSRKEIEIVKEIIDELIEDKELQKVLELAGHMITSVKKIPQGYKYCMRELASLGKPIALMNYAKLILMGEKSTEHEKKEAEEWLRKSADKNQPEILCFLGNYLIDYKKEEQLRQEGEQYLRQSILQGYQPGKMMLGSRLIDGKGITVNKDEGYELLEELVDEGHEMGILRLVHFLLRTEQLEANPEKAYQLLSMLAEERENISAMYNLGVNLIIGKRLKQNVQEGEQWLRRAADKESVQAMCFLGVELIEGENLPQHIDEGIEWLEKAIDMEHEESCLILAEYYLEGVHLKADFEQGKQWLLEAVKMRSTSAMLSLGRAYLYQLGGFPQDNDEALKWLQMAIEEGSNEACLILGDALVDGIGFKRNYSLGINYLQIAVKNEFVKAYSALGMAYLNGNGSSRKRIEGEKILREGMEKGCNFAKINLAIELVKGDKIKKRAEESKQLFDELIEDRFQDALSIRCQQSVKENAYNETTEDVQALLWREIEKGVPEAMVVLAEYLEEGEYMPQDIDTAILLYEQACSLEYRQAYLSYAVSLLSMDILPRDYEKGLQIIDKLLETEEGEDAANELLALHYYRNENNIDKAIECHLKILKKGNIESANDIFYLIRHDNASVEGQFDFNELLDMVKNSDKSLARVNYALYILSISMGEQTWREVDAIFTKLVEARDVEAWWTSLAKKADMEGYLVLGLLHRHQKIVLPNDWTLTHCFKQASSKYEIPHWIQKQR